MENSKVFDGVLTCMLSVLKRTHATDPFCFYIFTMDMTRIRPEYTPISEDMTDFLERVAKKFSSAEPGDFGGCNSII